ncbi:MAG: hypothetical protein KJ042_04085 [Deltaproteobacteria bacterium]|nr:hypothetical protein [Deltaproteobacteria bacterium]
MTAPLAEYLDRVAQFAHERFRIEMTEARRLYSARIGAKPENEDYYEEVMRGYLDWFLFERPLDDVGRTPLALFVEEIAGDPAERDHEVFAGFLHSRHGLFLITRVQDDRVECRDLFNDEKRVVIEENPVSFIKGEIFDARILPFQGELRFGDLIRFHPKRANKLIQNVAKDIAARDRDETPDLFIRLAQCKIKQYQFPRIDPLQFYKELM